MRSIGCSSDPPDINANEDETANRVGSHGRCNCIWEAKPTSGHR